MKKIAKRGTRINRLMEVQELTEEQRRFEERMAMMQTLIPLGIAAMSEEMQREAEALMGELYARGKRRGPWGSNRGSVCLGDQKVAVQVPRVRDRRTNAEVPLKSYRRLQQPHVLEDLALRRVQSQALSHRALDLNFPS